MLSHSYRCVFVRAHECACERNSKSAPCLLWLICLHRNPCLSLLSSTPPPLLTVYGSLGGGGGWEVGRLDKEV